MIIHTIDTRHGTANDATFHMETASLTRDFLGG